MRKASHTSDDDVIVVEDEDDPAPKRPKREPDGGPAQTQPAHRWTGTSAIDACDASSSAHSAKQVPQDASSSSSPASQAPFYLTKNSQLYGSGFNTNDYCVSFGDLLRLDGKLIMSVQFNYMFDMEWIASKYRRTEGSSPVVIVYGDSSGIADYNPEHDGPQAGRFHFIKAPNLDRWGTHHTKMMLLMFESCLRIVVHTANLIPRDWAAKTQGVWISPALPLRDASQPRCKGATSLHPPENRFGQDLWAYFCSYGTYRVGKCGMKEVRERVAAYDFSPIPATTRIVASVPGRHRGDARWKWGHMKLRALLKELLSLPASRQPSQQRRGQGSSASAAAAATDSPHDGSSRDEIVCQFSSIGSLGKNGSQPNSWLFSQLAASLTAVSDKAAVLNTKRPKLRVIYPTVENVRTSFEGYAAGGALPHSKSYEENHRFLRDLACSWNASWCGRTLAMPHIKTFLRWSPEERRIRWMVLTSHNLSKAAWGQLEKNETQIHIRSYELGVLLIPPTNEQFRLWQDRDHDPSCSVERDDGSIIWLPIPYDLPLQRYGQKDALWFVDKAYSKPDSHGNTWSPGT